MSHKHHPEIVDINIDIDIDHSTDKHPDNTPRPPEERPPLPETQIVPQEQEETPRPYIPPPGTTVAPMPPRGSQKTYEN